MPYLFRFSIRFAPFIAVLLFVTLPARAALFDDEEARRRADAVRLRVEQLERSLSQRLDALEATVKSQALADMLNEIQQIRSDIANPSRDSARSLDRPVGKRCLRASSN